LTIGLGGEIPGDPSVADTFAAALVRIRRACEDNGIAAGLHTRSGEEAAKWISEGFTLVTVSGDINHLEAVALAHLVAARGEQ
jgi:4-hydroxy-2-oxoheptanedioate aldolase